MDSGYVKLYRKITKSRVWKNSKLLHLWVWCLLKGSHKKRWVTIQTGRGTSEVEILPGQFVYGRKTSAQQTGLKPSTVRNLLFRLQKLGNVDIQPNAHYSIVSINNWQGYQCEEKKEDRQEDRQRTGKGQPKDTDKNVKNEKNITLAGDLYAFYLEEIMPKKKSKQRSISNINNHYFKNYPYEDLIKAVKNYKIEALERDPKYRKDPANFFGANEPFAVDYLPHNFTSGKEPPKKQKEITPENVGDLYAN